MATVFLATAYQRMLTTRQQPEVLDMEGFQVIIQQMRMEPMGYFIWMLSLAKQRQILLFRGRGRERKLSVPSKMGPLIVSTLTLPSTKLLSSSGNPTPTTCVHQKIPRISLISPKNYFLFKIALYFGHWIISPAAKVGYSSLLPCILQSLISLFCFFITDSARYFTWVRQDLLFMERLPQQKQILLGRSQRSQIILYQNSRAPMDPSIKIAFSGSKSTYIGFILNFPEQLSSSLATFCAPDSSPPTTATLGPIRPSSNANFLSATKLQCNSIYLIMGADSTCPFFYVISSQRCEEFLVFSYSRDYIRIYAPYQVQTGILQGMEQQCGQCFFNQIPKIYALPIKRLIFIFQQISMYYSMRRVWKGGILRSIYRFIRFFYIFVSYYQRSIINANDFIFIPFNHHQQYNKLHIKQMSDWKTSNQQYGSQHGRSGSGPKNKTKIGRSTLEYLESLDKGNFVHEQEKIAQRERHGLFTQPLGLSPGDLYQDLKPYQPSKGVQVNQRMQQKVGPQLFEKMGSTNIGDPYKDQFRAQQLYLKQKTDISIHPTSFLAGGKQKLVKHSEFEHKKQFDDKTYQTRDANGNVIVSKKGIFTNNMKKGYGNTTAGHLFSHYPYQGYPEDDGRQLDSNQRLIHKAKIPEPFKGGAHPSATFTDDFALYNKSEPYNPIKDDELYRGKSGGKWNYNNPNKKGYNGTFEKFPKYIDQGQKKKQPMKEQPVWIPNFNGTSKNVGETLTKPCPAPSQLTLNELRNARA